MDGGVAEKGGISAPSPFGCEGGCRQTWFDLLVAGVTAKRNEQQPDEVLLVLWNQLHPDQQFTPIPRKATTCEVRLADYLSDQGFGQST